MKQQITIRLTADGAVELAAQILHVARLHGSNPVYLAIRAPSGMITVSATDPEDAR